MWKKALSWEYRKKIGPFELHLDTYILLVLLLAVALISITFTSFHFPSWDDADYMRAASQAIDTDFRYLGSGFKPIFVSALAIGIMIFGHHDVVGVGVAALFGLLALYMTYLITQKVYRNKFFASTSALFLLLTSYFLYYARIPRPDGLFLFFSLFCMWVYLTIRDKNAKWLVLAGVLFGISVMIRANAIMLLPIFVLLELLALTKKEISLRQFFKRVLIVGLIFLAMYLAILTTYQLALPTGDNFEVTTTADDYNKNSAYKILDLITSPFTHVNFVYYPLVLWQMTSPIFLVLLIIGIAYSFWDAFIYKSERSFFLIAFVYLFIFLTFFPQHRYKVFFAIMGYASVLAARPMYLLARKRGKWYIVAALAIAMIIFAWPTLIYTGDSSYIAANYALDTKPEGLISSQHGVFMWYGMYSDGSDYHLPRSRIARLQHMETMEDLQAAYDDGFTIIILNHRGYDAPLREEVLATEPLAVFDNEIWRKDPIIRGHVSQVPYLRGSDRIKQDSFITNWDPADDRYNYIYVVATKDVLDTHLQE